MSSLRSAAGMKKSKPTRKFLDSYTIKGTEKVVKAGDCVVMRAQEVGKPPYIAKLEKIESDNRNHARVRVRWYYRPEESIGGRRQFHGSKEVFLSDHFDEQSADTIEGKCTVHTFKTYTKLESVGSEDYFCRFEYKAATGGFTPDRVAVYCKCEMPYNPDVLMAQCESCKDCVRSGAGMKKSKPSRNVLDSYTIKGTNTVVKAGDCVIMRAPEPGKPPYIAKVEKIESDNRKHAIVRVRWYYRPEEAIGGRRQFHGSKEVFLSDHFDEQSADTIEGKCTVHTFKTYIKLDSVGAQDYFCRFEYKAATGGFMPDRVAVYCKCELPYNPDVLMAQCEECKDWFHPPCMNLTAEQVKKMDHFFCSDCAEDGEKKPVNSVKDLHRIEQKEPEPKRRRLQRSK